MKLLKNMSYNCILNYKYDYLIGLQKMMNNNQSNIEVDAKIILSFFLIDYENAGLNEFDDVDMKRIYTYFDTYEKNENSTFEFSLDELNKLIEFSKTARVNIPFNKELATIFAKMYNNDHKYDLLFNIDIDEFRLWCENLLIDDQIVQ